METLHVILNAEDGRPNGEGRTRRETIVFLHGWPDTPETMENQAAYFEERGYRCVRVVLPFFSSDRCLVSLAVVSERYMYIYYLSSFFLVYSLLFRDLMTSIYDIYFNLKIHFFFLSLTVTRTSLLKTSLTRGGGTLSLISRT